MTFSWKIMADWNGNGLYDHANSDISDYWLSLHWRLGMRDAFQHMSDEAEAEIVLDNTSGIFNPENTSSPLYGVLLPGRKVAIRSVLNAVETVMYVGEIESIYSEWQPASGSLAGRYQTTLALVGFKQLMQDTKILPPLWTTIYASQGVNDIMDWLSIPVATMQQGISILPRYGDMRETPAWTIVTELVESERGRFFQNREGKAVFWNRHHLITQYTSTATVSYTSGNYKPYDLEYGYAEHMSNRINVQVYPRTVESSPLTLWTLESPVYVPANGSREFFAPLRKSGGQWVSAVALTKVGETFSSGSATVTITGYGGAAKVTITNSSASPAVLSALSLEGIPIVRQSPISVEKENASSISAYGLRGYRQIDLPAEGSMENADQIALYELQRRSTPWGAAKTVSFRRKADGVDNLHMLSWTIGTRITIDIPHNGSAKDYYIMGEEHWVYPGDLHETMYNLEPADPQRYWLLGVVGYGELGQTTILAF